MNILSATRNLQLCTELCFLMCFSAFNVHAESDATSARSVVQKLYQDYAWVVLIDDTGLVRLVDQPETELSKYFTSSLSSLISKDHKCAEETKDICNLDFDPIYDSQAPDGAHQLRIEPINPDSLIRVVFLRQWSSPDIAELRYKMVRTPAGWRIDDIYYNSHESIRAILQHKH